MRYFALILLILGCSKPQAPNSSSTSDSIIPSAALEKEIETVNQKLPVEYAISAEDLALLTEEEVLSAEELAKLAKLGN